MKEQNCIICGTVVASFIPICDTCLDSEKFEREYNERVKDLPKVDSRYLVFK